MEKKISSIDIINESAKMGKEKRTFKSFSIHEYERCAIECAINKRWKIFNNKFDNSWFSWLTEGEQ